MNNVHKRAETEESCKVVPVCWRWREECGPSISLMPEVIQHLCTWKEERLQRDVWLKQNHSECSGLGSWLVPSLLSGPRSWLKSIPVRLSQFVVLIKLFVIMCQVVQGIHWRISQRWGAVLSDLSLPKNRLKAGMGQGLRGVGRGASRRASQFEWPQRGWDPSNHSRLQRCTCQSEEFDGCLKLLMRNWNLYVTSLMMHMNVKETVEMKGLNGECTRHKCN